MSLKFISLATLGAMLVLNIVAIAMIQRAPANNHRMDAALGRVFIVDSTEYVSARIYHVADHIICVGQGGKELILHVAAIENITKHTNPKQEANK